jgi:hypothetical protein
MERIFLFSRNILEIKSKTKPNKEKAMKRNETEPKNCENKSQKAQNLIKLKILDTPDPDAGG